MTYKAVVVRGFKSREDRADSDKLKASTIVGQAFTVDYLKQIVTKNAYKYLAFYTQDGNRLPHLRAAIEYLGGPPADEDQ
jgi:hypothetical protein